MCGRTACALAPDDICKAMRYKSKNGKYQKPKWKDAPGGKKYYPSHNIAPASHTPVMLSSRHYQPGEIEEDVDRVIQPMKWGLVPSWHKGDPYKLEYETNNCRSEGMLTKRTYKVPLEKGQRCVILAEGFFEWKRSKESKQPYFIYFPRDSKPDVKTEDKQIKSEMKVETDVKKENIKDEIIEETDSENNKLKQPEENVTDIKKEVKVESDCETKVNVESDCETKVKVESDNKTKVKVEPSETSDGYKDVETDNKDSGNLKSNVKSENTPADDVDEEEWTGNRLLTMAGVFEVWKPPDGSDDIYSYSIITVDSSPAMAWIHHRMPAILTTDEEVNEWIDFGNVPLQKACKLIHPTECVMMHPVSTLVNNSRNKSPDCVVKIDPGKPKKSASSNFMMSWLGEKNSDNDEEPASKRSKTH